MFRYCRCIKKNTKPKYGDDDTESNYRKLCFPTEERIWLGHPSKKQDSVFILCWIQASINI